MTFHASDYLKTQTACVEAFCQLYMMQFQSSLHEFFLTGLN